MLVVEDVRLGLVNGRPNLAEFEEAFELGRADVAHAQTADLAFAVELFALLPDFIKRDLVRLKFFTKAHAAERRVDIDERLPLCAINVSQTLRLDGVISTRSHTSRIMGAMSASCASRLLRMLPGSRPIWKGSGWPTITKSDRSLSASCSAIETRAKALSNPGIVGQGPAQSNMRMP